VIVREIPASGLVRVSCGYWTSDDDLDRPLTTFSGGEAFAYDLQNLKRATLVGETTEGAAHPRDVYRINEHFWMGIPNARPVSPITQTNWERTGVKPDIEVPAELALKTAHIAALRKLLDHGTDEARKERLSRVIETIQRELEEMKKSIK